MKEIIVRFKKVALENYPWVPFIFATRSCNSIVATPTGAPYDIDLFGLPSTDDVNSNIFFKTSK